MKSFLRVSVASAVTLFLAGNVSAQNPGASSLVINEVMFDVPQDAAGDANGDGTRSARADEFVEIVNTGTQAVDISGYKLLERDLSTIFIFPNGVSLKPGEYTVVFGGVAAGGFGSGFPASLKLFAAKQGDADGGFSAGTKTNLSNSNDSVILVNPAASDTIAEIHWGSSVRRTSKAVKFVPPNTVVGDSIVGAVRMSVTREPDLTGKWQLHQAASSAGLLFSPGANNEGVITAVSVREGEAIPQSFVLHQNHPNPFNPQTEIRFEVPRQGRVVLEIYDALGRHVQRLLDKPHAAGTYRVTWQAGAVPSGIYFYRLNFEGVIQTRRMILMR